MRFGGGRGEEGRGFRGREFEARKHEKTRQGWDRKVLALDGRRVSRLQHQNLVKADRANILHNTTIQVQLQRQISQH